MSPQVIQVLRMSLKKSNFPQEWKIQCLLGKFYQKGHFSAQKRPKREFFLKNLFMRPSWEPCPYMHILDENNVLNIL